MQVQVQSVGTQVSENSSFVETDVHRAKRMDMEIAQKIASYGGMTLRDRHLNLSDDVWQAANTIKDTTKLLDTSSMRRILIDQLNQHLEAQRDLLLVSDSQEVLVQWIIDFQNKWEKKIAAQHEEKYDISMKILTVMEESLIAVECILREHEISEQEVLHILRPLWSTMQEHTYKEHDTYVRVMYRNEVLGPHLCRVAGKLLQKQLVCNRSGAYSSTKQRNDVTQERDEAMMQLTRFLNQDGQRNVHAFVRSLQASDVRVLLINHCMLE